MKTPQKRTLIEEELQTEIVIDSTVEELTSPPKIARICWNTGEEKNCPACYLSKGCKAK
jgi:hypothetical protein